MLNKICFKACFGEICAKLAVFYEILTLNLVILANLRKKIWPLFGLVLFLRIWSFKSAYGQIWHFKFF